MKKWLSSRSQICQLSKVTVLGPDSGTNFILSNGIRTRKGQGQVVHLVYPLAEEHLRRDLSHGVEEQLE